MSQSNTSLRWGILGAARINQQLMPAIVQANNSKLIAIASHREGAAQALLDLYAPNEKNITLYSSPDELLNNDDIQAVYIPVATEDHAYWTLQAIQKGKHVLCEKPMALTVDDIIAIQKAAKQHNVKVMEGFMYRFHPQQQRTQAIIDSGLIGEVRSVRTCFAYPMQPARLYRINRPIAQGGGAMWDIGCYAIHAARFAFGDCAAQSVQAMAEHNEHGADMSSSGIINFGDGKYAQFNFSFQHARRAEYEIIGTKGGIKCHNVWAKADEQPLISWWNETEQHTETLETANHFQLEVEHFCDAVLNDTPLTLSLNDAQENCKLINGVLQAVEQKKTIQF